METESFINHIDKSTLLLPIQRHFNPVHAAPSYFLNLHFNIIHEYEENKIYFTYYFKHRIKTQCIDCSLYDSALIQTLKCVLWIIRWSRFKSLLQKG